VLSKGRAVLSFLADLAGALAFVSVALGLLIAAFVGAALAAWTAFPQPYFTLLVVAVALLGTGLALHFLRDWLTPLPATSPPAPPQPVATNAGENPLSQAAALQRRHEIDEQAAAKREADVALRRAVRRIREELLDNDRAVSRSSSELDELLNVSFDQWRTEQSTLLDAEDPEPHERASEAYRQIRSVLTGRVFDDGMSSSYTQGSRPASSEVNEVRRAIDKAVQALQAAEASAAPERSSGG
jgi:hypothetical protein